jgi:hypothetical protein
VKLNAYILYERLKEKYPVTLYGRAGKDLSLLAPELYMDGTENFYSNHVYLATVEHLPHRPNIERNVVLICIGEHPRLNYYKEHATVILIKQKVNFFEVYNDLQKNYLVYHNWESQLLDLLIKSPTIQGVIDYSYSIFERPIMVLDNSYEIVAQTQQLAAESFNFSNSQKYLASESFLIFSHEQDVYLDRHGAFQLDFDPGITLCVNLFDSRDEYIGCLVIGFEERPFVEGEEKLAEYLADIITKVVEYNPSLLMSKRNSLQEILENLMQEAPLNPNQKMYLSSVNHKQDYLCISIHYLQRFSALPVIYICSVFENMFADSIFFGHNNTIMGLVPALEIAEKSPGTQGKSEFLSYIDQMQICVGLSNIFSDLNMIRIYYLQAEAAIEHGRLNEADEYLFAFSDFALDEMVANSLGIFPLETFFPNGFSKLLEHDKNGGISYVYTLRIFLESNMSYSEASRQLFIHRSTLLDRIYRIQKDLKVDLDDPDQRLQLQIVLKALQLTEE